MGLSAQNLGPSNSQKGPIKEISSIAEIMPQYDLFILDLWGVIYDGTSIFPKVKDTLKELKKQNKQVIFITNNPCLAAANISNLEKLGLNLDEYDRLVSAGDKAFHLFTTGQIFGDLPSPIKAYVFDFDTPTSWIEDANIQRVNNIDEAHILLGIHIPTTLQNVDNYHLLLRKALSLKLPFVCCNPDLFVTQNGRKIIRIGSLALRYENIGGPVVFIGKPYPTIYEDILKDSAGKAFSKNKALIIGDSLTTDIRGACNIGIDSLLITSGYHAEDFAQSMNILEFLNNIPHHPNYICSHFC